MCACCANPSGGGNTRSSWSIDSIFGVAVDMRACVPQILPIANCRLPIFLFRARIVSFDKSAIGNRKSAMIYVGTSGYSYKEWKGSFYPERLSPKEMLSYYAARFKAVELNNTFYRYLKRCFRTTRNVSKRWS